MGQPVEEIVRNAVAYGELRYVSLMFAHVTVVYTPYGRESIVSRIVDQKDGFYSKTSGNGRLEPGPALISPVTRSRRCAHEHEGDLVPCIDPCVIVPTLLLIHQPVTHEYNRCIFDVTTACKSTINEVAAEPEGGISPSIMLDNQHGRRGHLICFDNKGLEEGPLGTTGLNAGLSEPLCRVPCSQSVSCRAGQTSFEHG